MVVKLASTFWLSLAKQSRAGTSKTATQLQNWATQLHHPVQGYVIIMVCYTSHKDINHEILV
jgi:hypothetical protein